MPTVDDDRVYAISAGGNLACLEAATGKLRWEKHLAREFRGTRPGWGYSESALLNGDPVLRTPGGFEAEEVWNNRILVNQIGGVVKVGDYIYGLSDSGRMVCQDFKSGEQKWAERSVGKGAGVFADGMLYCRSEGGRGNIAPVEAPPTGCFQRGRFEPPGRSAKSTRAHPSSPAAASSSATRTRFSAST